MKGQVSLSLVLQLLADEYRRKGSVENEFAGKPSGPLYSGLTTPDRPLTLKADSFCFRSHSAARSAVLLDGLLVS